MAHQISLLVLAQQSMQQLAASGKGEQGRSGQQQLEELRGLQQQYQQALEEKVGVVRGQGVVCTDGAWLDASVHNTAANHHSIRSPVQQSTAAVPRWCSHDSSALGWAYQKITSQALRMQCWGRTLRPG